MDDVCSHSTVDSHLGPPTKQSDHLDPLATVMLE